MESSEIKLLPGKIGGAGRNRTHSGIANTQVTDSKKAEKREKAIKAVMDSTTRTKVGQKTSAVQHSQLIPHVWWTHSAGA
jgi:hypothetical protein